MSSPLVQARKRLGTGPVALRLLSRAVAFAAPYFRTIGARFTRFDPGHVEAVLPKRRGVTNHIGTVHAIAMCNAAELVGGSGTDLVVPDGMRWIPVGMTVRYLALAKTDLRAVCIIDDLTPFATPGDVDVHVDVFDASDTLVFDADITMRISPAKR